VCSALKRTQKPGFLHFLPTRKVFESIIEWEGKNNLAPENTQRKVLRETFERNFLES
jgi:hypothetical protein